MVFSATLRETQRALQFRIGITVSTAQTGGAEQCRRVRGEQISFSIRSQLVNRLVRLAIGFLLFFPIPLLLAQSAAPQTGSKPLTIESIFAEGGITGRGPENIKWSPDNTKFSFIQRDDTGEHGQLWYVDATTGEKKVLLNEVKLTALALPLSQLKDDRARDRITRYHIPAYLWSPDSKHLLFTPEGRLWLFTVDNGTAI